MRILVVEDDAEAATAMVRGLSEAGHEVTHAVDGAFGLLESQKGGYDVYVVDRMMPRLDGVGMVETVRKGGDQTPVLFLSALGEVEDRVTGLKAGADDYLVKPYAFAELIARVEALLRRPNDTRETRLTAGPLDLDLLTGSATRAGRDLALLPRELKLLDYMVRRPGRIITRSMLLQDVWGYNFEPNTNVVDVHMGRLRRKVDGEGEVQLIRNVRGQGYVFDLPH